jgi:predicted esterase
MKRIISTTCFCALLCTSFAQIDQSLSYEELQNQAVGLLRKANIDSAIIVIEYAVEKFPEEEQWSTSLLAQLYTRAGKKEEAVAIWKAGMEKGYNYNLVNPAYNQFYENNNDFMELRRKEETRNDASHIMHEVILPANYSATKRYPVLFIFHGNNRNIAMAKESWVSKVMKEEYISVFLQSYIYATNTTYSWRSGDVRTGKEFKEIYNQIMSRYKVDTSGIIMAGMSAGGSQALYLAFNQFVPISGLILNCPVIPAEISDEQLEEFVAMNRRIGIITGENDFALEAQKSIVGIINEAGGEGKITVNKDAGHEFVQGFPDLLDQYLGWIIK